MDKVELKDETANGTKPVLGDVFTIRDSIGCHTYECPNCKKINFLGFMINHNNIISRCQLLP